MRKYFSKRTSTVSISNTETSVNQIQKWCKLIRNRQFQLISGIGLLITIIIIIFIVSVLKNKMKIHISTTVFLSATTTTTTKLTTPTTTTEKPTDFTGMKNWKPNGTTVTGGNGRGNALNQFSLPHSIYIDDNDKNQTLYIVDSQNHRVLEWKVNATSGRIVAGRNRSGSDTSYLSFPTDIIFDKKTDSMIISDSGNCRVMRWSHRNVTHGEILMSNTDCMGLTADKDGYFYVTDIGNKEIRRWDGGMNNGSIIACGFFEINQTRILSMRYHIAIDTNGSIYISDRNNHAVVKWKEGTEKGIIVAGGNGPGDQLTQLFAPMGIALDDSDNIYVADSDNHRIVCWKKGEKEGRVVVGGKGNGNGTDQLSWPYDLSFDKYGNLYVADAGNDRIQKFLLD